MNYWKLYNLIIEKRRKHSPDGYSETHHIIPRSLGGTDDKSNLVKLTAKEHFICHLLLTKMYPKGSNEYYKMSTAFLMMLVSSKDQKRYITSRKYDELKKQFTKHISLLQKGKNNSQYGTQWISNIELKKSKKISIDDDIPSGWCKGRIVDFDKALKKRQENIKKEEILKNNILKYNEWHELYILVGWEKFVELTGYDKTQDNLTKRFKQYCPSFLPQNGKKRGNENYTAFI